MDPPAIQMFEVQDWEVTLNNFPIEKLVWALAVCALNWHSSSIHEWDILVVEEVSWWH